MRFYLGTHEPNWLEKTSAPLFVSRRRIAGRKNLPRAVGRWALDSGGFTELSMFGGWMTTPEQYAKEVARFRDEIGGMDWASIQDWMCEPHMLLKTGLTVRKHQDLTVDNYLTLKEIAPEIPWVPVLQGWTNGQYYDHLESYSKRGIELEKEPLVGLGSVCRRQNTDRIGGLLIMLEGISLHGFGFKVQGLKKYCNQLASADSLAWSFSARMSKPMPGHSHKSCSNCIDYAMDWLSGIQSIINNQRGA